VELESKRVVGRIEDDGSADQEPDLGPELIGWRLAERIFEAKRAGPG
jgi:hypothetical protein